MKEGAREIQNSKGVALIMVLWVMAILSVVVMEFCFAMRTEIQMTRHYKEEFNLYAMAQGGIQRAVTELIYKFDSRIQQLRKPLEEEEVPAEKKEWVTDGRAYLLPFDQGSCEVRVMSEGGKVNINIVSESTLRRIIGNLGLESDTLSIIVDSIMDWRDPDDFYRMNGAENDYYQSLKEPYKCKNGNLDTIEELLLVRGITPELFYGKNGRPGLKNIFSIYAMGEQVDINSAMPPVLSAFLGIPNEISQRITKAREEKRFQNSGDLIQRVPELAPIIGAVGSFLVFSSPSRYFTIEARAKTQDGNSLRGVKTIVRIELREKNGYKVIQWVDKIF
jgi:general secretion pathway protein K